MQKYQYICSFGNALNKNIQDREMLSKYGQTCFWSRHLVTKCVTFRQESNSVFHTKKVFVKYTIQHPNQNYANRSKLYSYGKFSWFCIESRKDTSSALQTPELVLPPILFFTKNNQGC